MTSRAWHVWLQCSEVEYAYAASFKQVSGALLLVVCDLHNIIVLFVALSCGVGRPAVVLALSAYISCFSTALLNTRLCPYFVLFSLKTLICLECFGTLNVHFQRLWSCLDNMFY